MKIKRLDLKAFGPFTNQTLEFKSKDPGLHIIFGPNEAGKSSSLRALKALLYGFPQQTPDNFLHNYDQLQVGGCLEGADGKELFFWRRKKKKADLLDSEGNPIDSGELAGFLHGVEPALFESLYGIDHKTLEEGGEDILAQKGEVGQALFAAGAGISSLHKILDSLDTEADELFRSRGTKQQINQAIKEYKELKRLVKDASLPSSKWKEHQKLLQRRGRRNGPEHEEESRQKSAEVQRLERLCKSIPELGRTGEPPETIPGVGDVVVLSSDFPEQRQQVEQDIRQSKLQLDKDSSRLEKLKAKQKENSVNQPLLDHAETIEDLHQRLDRYRNGKNDRIRLDGMRISNRKDAAALIKEVRPDLRLEDAESLRPVLSKKRTIQTLSSQYEALTQQILQAQKLRAEAEKDLKGNCRYFVRPAYRQRKRWVDKGMEAGPESG